MKQAHSIQQRILAICLSSRGLGFAVLEGPETLVDWGVRQPRSEKNKRVIDHVRNLIRHYNPEALILEDCSAKGCRRGPRARTLAQAVALIGEARQLQVHSVSRQAVRAAFCRDGAFTKQQIAASIALRLPVLIRSLPPLRKPWMSEDARMTMFDALAFGFTYYEQLEKSRFIPTINANS